ncbi:plasma-membrane proton-efflux P-type ATPase [Isoptericola sp. b408]|uniref:plasma-membrane proton-efflux P-type ATPase n=1 Tax=Isoptericola sp. b408 TaxID=3064653 RepID=UPI002712481A|nr:plasma-membrane proton-efflux P-type ATPase [Isoptericola sp. b408]MDO8151172.1 plasma-membrane proton-efflux P-type ATPase [Isoptericola sp. b408]
MSTADLSSLPLEDLLEELGATPSGLTTAEATERLDRYGANEIIERRKNPLLVLAGYFWGPIPWMIEAALVLSLVLGSWSDAVIIGVLLAMNGAVAFSEEHQATRAIEALQERLATSARVRRDGVWTTVPVREVVPGDVVRLRLGDVVPADVRLLEDAELHVDQSALTGESLPVTRGQGDAAWSGSVITRGEADAVVYATGEDSYFGRTATLVESAGVVSHFQRAVLRIGRYLIVIAVTLVTLTSVVALLRGNDLAEILQFALVVVIASVPVALPAVLSVTMAVGARALARRQAVVSHLPAVEELGGIDVLCSDKTGTLTRNRLAVGDPWCASGVGPAELLEAAAVASRAEDQDPIDLAVLAAAEHPDETSAGRLLHFTPFDPVGKRTEATVRQEDGRTFRVSKGAPQMIAALCGDDPAVAESARQVDDFARRGYRSLAVARTDGADRWHLLGVLPLADPPREDSRETIDAARDLGIEVKMVTGDQVAIGAEIARQVGLGDRILPASALGDEDTPEDTRARLVAEADGFAEVFPEHKYRIVELLQRRGRIVAMTGDGVNDAPALKQADAGIAVSDATDAARSAADVVLMAPGLSVIVDAIRMAREIFARMTSYATYRIAETIRVLLLITLAIVFLDFFPVTAVMIVLLAVLNDAAILTIAYDHVRGSDRPARWRMGSVLTVATALGLAGVVASFLLFLLADLALDLDRELIQTLIYLKLSVAGHLTIFVTRTRGPFWSRPAPAPVLVAAVLGTQAIATVIAATGFLMAPIGWAGAGLVWAYALLWFLVNDRVKLAAHALVDRRAARRAARDRVTLLRAEG